MSNTPRKIKRHEQAAVAALWHDAWHETQAPFVPNALISLRTKPDFLRRLIAMGDLARVIGPANAPLGFCATKNDELNQLFVSPQARGTGAAAALVKDAEDRLRAAGTTTAHLDCLKENTAAIRFYEKMGWTAQGVQPATLDTSAGPFALDCIVFTKTLT
jgi:GNAT superfamily N-acetyltransferase